MEVKKAGKKQKLGKCKKKANKRKYTGENKELLLMNSRISKYRTLSQQAIIKDFQKVYKENEKLALKALFYWGDIKNGKGERRLFKVILKYLAKENPRLVKALIPYVPEYTRWDNLWILLDTPVKDEVIKLVDKQLMKDIIGMTQGQKISLCAKWLPSANTSSDRTRRYARIITKGLHLKEKNYRKSLSLLRRYLNIVECMISRNEWQNIDYKKIPACASQRYNKAFLKHDTYRREQYLKKIKREKEHLKKISNSKMARYNTKNGILKILNSDAYKPLERSFIYI